jgi:hypothetical protein
MFDQITEMFARDWNLLMVAASSWMHGGNPYAALRREWAPGAFAYPPTTLPWLALFAMLGGASFIVWTGLQLFAWWRLVRKTAPTQLLLICWAPLIINCISGQTTFAVVLILWGAYQASDRHWQTARGANVAFLWGAALSLTSMKPQVALLPVLYLLWLNRGSTKRWHLLGGLALGFAVTAIVPMIANPRIWNQWQTGVRDYMKLNTLATPWQDPLSFALVVAATVLWYRSRRGGWQWWVPAALQPQNAVYSMILLMPALRPHRNYWSLAGLALAGIFVAPNPPVLTLPLLLSIQLLAVWMIAGGPAKLPVEPPARAVGS